jgi:hypothetical protein
MAPMLHLARGHSLRESGLFSFPSLSTDLVLAMLGVSMAAFWGSNPWLIPFSVAPLLLIHRSLSVPQLQEEARVDPKTGPVQREALRASAERGAAAGRALRATAVAGDGRPRPAARHQQHLRPSRRRCRAPGHRRGLPLASAALDVPARFGGEEFAILLPETTPDQAFEIAERIRRTVAGRTFDVETSSEPIRATVSIGVAGFPRDGATRTS